MAASCGLAATWLVLATGSAVSAETSNYQALYDFRGPEASPPDGAAPSGGVAFDGNSTLIGTTRVGGRIYQTSEGYFGVGTAFKIKIGKRATKSAVSIFKCCVFPKNPAFPMTVFNKDYYISAEDHGGRNNVGTLFVVNRKLTPYSNKPPKMIYAFDERDALPSSGLIMSNGEAFGVTSGGGFGFGTIYKVSLDEKTSKFSKSQIYAFNFTEGHSPSAPLIKGPNGTFFGITKSGGQNGSGAVFQLLPPKAGESEWTTSYIYQFNEFIDDFFNLQTTSIAADEDGNFYGTSAGGGRDGMGVVFQLLKPAKPGEVWKSRILYSFRDPQTGEYPDGWGPTRGVAIDDAGNLYGTTSKGGRYDGGVIFKLTRPDDAAGKWSFSAIHHFKNYLFKNEGYFPTHYIIIKGKYIYGSAGLGGKHDYGVIYRYRIAN